MHDRGSLGIPVFVPLSSFAFVLVTSLSYSVNLDQPKSDKLEVMAISQDDTICSSIKSLILFFSQEGTWYSLRTSAKEGL